MASINRLAIRGVRAFSPTDDEQVLEFFLPCTIIVGANGCGKTTIIESLKYALTGSLPPGNKSGQAFVHDPRSIGSPVVKAQVKLRFTNRRGDQMVVLRSMELAQKKTSLTFKQLDGALRSFDRDTGKVVSLSHKCTELDKQVPSCLGVSKAILEHVLFCHQEDASWPLMEGAVLKKRFDEIFDSTRYTKAIDVFRKTEKEMLSKVKDHKADVSGYSSHLHAANNFKKELNEQKEQLEHLDEEKKRLTEEIKEAEGILEKTSNIIDQLEEIDTKIDQLSQQQIMKQELVDKQQEMLEEDLTKKHDVRKLEAMLQEFDEKATSQVERLQDLNDEEERIEAGIAKLRNEESQLAKEKARLEAGKEAQEQQRRERYEKMQSMAQKYTLNLSQAGNLSFDGSFVASQATVGTIGSNTQQEITDDDVEEFMAALSAKEDELKGQYEQTRKKHQKDEDDIAKTLTDLELQQKSIENERKKINLQRDEMNREIRDLSSQTESRSRVRKTEIDELRNQAKRCAEDRDKLISENRKDDIAREIRKLESKTDTLKREIDDNRNDLDSLRRSADTQNAINMLQEQSKKDMESLEDEIRDKWQTLENLAPTDQEIPSSVNALTDYVESLTDSTQKQLQSKKKDLGELTEKIAKTQRNVNERNAIIVNNQQTVSAMRKKLDHLEASTAQAKRIIEEIRRHEADLGLAAAITKESSVNDVVQYLDGRINALEEDSPDVDTDLARRILKKLKKMAVKKDSSQSHGYAVVCPCCEREMREEEAARFQQKMNSLMEDSPFVSVNQADVAKHKKNKAQYGKWKKEILILADDVRECRRLKEECAKLEVVKDSLDDDLVMFQSSLNQQKDQLKKLQDEVDDVRNLFQSCSRWSQDVNKIGEKQSQIEQKKQYLQSYQSSMMSMSQNPNRTLAQVEEDLSEKMEEKDKCLSDINKLNKELATINNKISTFSTQASKFEALVREKEEKYAAEQKSLEKKAEIQSQIARMKEDDVKLQEQLAPLARKIETKARDKDRARALKESEVNSSQNALIEFQGEMRDLQRIAKAIDALASSDPTDELEKLKTKSESLQNKIGERIEEQKARKPELERLRLAVQDQERHKKMLRANIDVLESKQSLKAFDDEIEKLEDEKRDVEGADTAADEQEKASRKKQKRQGELARLEGRWMEVVESIRSVKRKLSTPEYRNVDEEHRVALIKLHTTQLAAEDLKKYWNAVDKALLKYHSVKIAEINKIVRELWLLCYKGGDISNIEIVSGQDSASRSNRSYNYRVVMTKGSSSQLDMRGRCSAGQRVLASIVIRLALAETFGVNCGCIALDEPTVNLDYANKKGLAVALAQIIAARAHQANFQLILITHDEEFVSMVKTQMSVLTGFSMPEKYFQVRRERASDGKYYSKINEKDWSDLI